MGKRVVAVLTCLLAAILLLPATAFAQDFTPNAWLDDDGVLHWDAEGEYYSGIDLYPLMFGPNSDDSCMPPVNGEYSYDIENLFQAAEQFYAIAGSVEGLNGYHPVTFVYYEKQQDDTMKEVGRAEGTYSYLYTTGQLVQLATPSNLTWTGGGFTASWDAVANAAEYRVTFYETTADGSTSQVGSTTIADTSCELTSVVTAPKNGATYAFDVRAWGPEENYEYRASETSAKSAASAAWKTPVVEYGLSVGGVDVTSENAADVLGDNTVSYDPKTQTLTLNGAKITGTDQAGLAIETDQTVDVGPITIELVGENSCGSIWARWGSPLTITGEGSLTVKETALGCAAVQSQEDITIDGAELVVTSGEGGIHSNGGSVAIGNGAQVNVKVEGVDAYYAVWAQKNVEVMDENTKLEATTNDTDAPVGDEGHYAIHADTGTVTIGSGAYVEAGATVYSQQQLTVTGNGTVLDVVGTAAGRTAVSGQATVSIEDGAKVEATGRFYGKNGISVTDSSLTVNSIGDYFAIDAQGPITATNSTLNATCDGTIAVYIWDNDSPMTFTNSTVTTTSANSYALYALAGGIEVSGGSLTLNAPESYATYTTGDLTVKDGAQLTLTNVAHGLAAAGTVELDNATGTVTAGNAALYSDGKDVVIENCSDLVLSGKMTVNAQRGGISISESDLNVSGTDAIYAKQDLSITDSQIEVIATGRPIAGGSVTISGETTDIDATGGWYIGASDELVISGGKVTVDVTTDPDESVMGALYGNNAVRISGGTVDATVSQSDDADITYALMTNGVAEFTGGTTTLKGGDGAIYVSKNGGSVSFGSNPAWYQWATSPTGEVVRAEDDSYSYAEDKSTYLRIEPATPLYELRVQGGTGGGMYAEGAEVTISTEEYDDYGHFTGWYVVDTGGGKFEDRHDATTTFTMPANDTNVVAGYEDHELVRHDAKAPTCTEPGWEAYVTCEGCDYTTYVEIPAAGHTYEDGTCVDCGAEDPDYQEPEQPGGTEEPEEPDQPGDPGEPERPGEPEEPGDPGESEEPEQPAEPETPEQPGAADGGGSLIPATGDASALLAAVPALGGAAVLAAGVLMRRRR
ncbi:InlB B-repeat-containing protein [Collinsella tanakaei]|uniref:InlB B-repeat-containing protein n=1 Tax=Collinsella tanakaei TaxID=626935 RepID=UPI001F2CF47B|nr:hypothetical protein [Collinsella tanakaei]MCF2622272.1 hypothetical protein [Collinsella tanakaei]